MQAQHFVRGLAVIAALAIPSVASAQTTRAGVQIAQAGPQNTDFYAMLRSLNLSDAQRQSIRSIVNSNQDPRTTRQQVLNVLNDQQRAELRRRMTGAGAYGGGRDGDDRGNGGNRGGNNGYGNNGYGNNGYGNNGYNGNANVFGVVSSFHSFDLYLNNGRHVELHQGTVINPTGTTLQQGMRVSIQGTTNADGSINANVINVTTNNGYNGNGNGYGRGRGRDRGDRD